MKAKQIRKLSAVKLRKTFSLMLVCFFAFVLPLKAVEETPPPQPPYEKVVAKRGSWYAAHGILDGEQTLTTGYRGSYDAPEYYEQTFSLSQQTVISSIRIPLPEVIDAIPNLIITDSQGNVYQGFSVQQDVVGGINEYRAEQESTTDPTAAKKTQRALLVYTSKEGMVLPNGAYQMQFEEKLPIASSFLISGYYYRAYEEYLMQLKKWNESQLEEIVVSTDAEVRFGNEEIGERYDQFLYGETGDERETDSQIQTWTAPQFQLESSYSIDEIILSTYQGGLLGIKPGVIKILDQSGKIIASFPSHGASDADVANAFWVVKPQLTLQPGMYTIDIDEKDALDFSSDGSPLFFLEASIPVVKPTNFTGTYKIRLDLVKTHTLMGPVTDQTSSLSMEDYELVVLDKGSVIELIGQYELIPFSQNCEVIERDENTLVANIQFASALVNRALNANVSANAKITLTKEPNGVFRIDMSGQGFYSRAATKEKGADNNTYQVTMRGNLVKKNLPPYVMSAIASVYGAGNIPGPDTPFEAAAGILFPPLIGLIINILQSLSTPKPLETKLSVGEQAMKDANQSLGKGLYTEEEAEAWSKMADALGASGGDSEDAVSMGDNESPSTSDANDWQTEYEPEADEVSDEDLSFGKPDVPEAQPQQPVIDSPKPEQPPEVAIAEPESMVVQTSFGGGQTLITKDPVSGQWVNAESGNPFDLEAHQRNFPQQRKQYEEYLKRNEELERTGQTAMHKAMDDIEKKRQQEWNQIQKEIDARRREQLERDQKNLEWERENAQKLSGWGRIVGDSVRNAGDEIAQTADELAREAKDALVITKDALKMTARDLFVDQKKALQNINESVTDVKNTLNSVKDKAITTAKEIYNKPHIVVKGVMEAGKAVVDTVTDPKKAWEWAKDTVGVNDFSKSLDPNLTLIQRLKHTFSGTIKLGTTIGSAGQAGAALKGSGKLAGVMDDILGAGSKKISATGALPKGIKPSLTLKTGPSYTNLNRAPNVSGVTQTSRKIIQNTADEFGVQIKARPTTAKAEAWLNSGKAAPKPLQIKAKTLNKYDELLGGPKGTEGVVGFYEPKLPPKDVMKRLSKDTQTALVKQYQDRRREFHHLSEKMKSYEASGDFKVIDGRVFNRDGKLLTGDVDIYDVVNFDGTPVKESVKKQVLDSMMKKQGSNVMHDDVLSWKKGGIDFSQKAKDAMIDAATSDKEGKGLTSYNPLSEPSAQTYVKGINQ